MPRVPRAHSRRLARAEDRVEYDAARRVRRCRRAVARLYSDRVVQCGRQRVLAPDTGRHLQCAKQWRAAALCDCVRHVFAARALSGAVRRRGGLERHILHCLARAADRIGPTCCRHVLWSVAVVDYLAFVCQYEHWRVPHDVSLHHPIVHGTAI